MPLAESRRDDDDLGSMSRDSRHFAGSNFEVLMYIA
jgi:hypothetical protein